MQNEKQKAIKNHNSRINRNTFVLIFLIIFIIILIGIILSVILIIRKPKETDLANINITSNLIDDTNVIELSSKNYVYSTKSSIEKNLSDGNLHLEAGYSWEYIYTIENISDDSIIAYFKIEKEYIKNIIFTVYIDGEEVDYDSSLSHLINKDEEMQLKVIVDIADRSMDAVLKGNFNLVLNRG